MPPTIISKRAGNWVDRGEPAAPTLRRILARHFSKFAEADAAWLDEHATIIAGMVEADASEVLVAGYLNSLAGDAGEPTGDQGVTRLVAIALWHVAKAALVRDFAERVLSGEVPPNIPTEGSLSDWLRARLIE